MEDVLGLIEAHRGGLCRQTLALNHVEAQRQVRKIATEVTMSEKSDNFRVAASRKNK